MSMDALRRKFESLNPRERFLAIATAAVVVVVLAMQLMGGGDDSESAFSVSSDAVEAAKAEYDGLVDDVSFAPQVMKQFVALVGRTESAEDLAADNSVQRPDLDFQNEVAEWCKDIGMPTPNFELETEDIEDVDEYVMVAVTTDIDDADLTRVARLLKTFELRGVIVQEVEISNRLDSPSLDATIRAARIVPRFSER